MTLSGLVGSKGDVTALLFLFCRRNILPTISSTYLKNCIYDAQTDPFCPIFRLGKIVEAAGQDFQEMAVEVFGRFFSWASAVFRRGVVGGCPFCLVA